MKCIGCKCEFKNEGDFLVHIWSCRKMGPVDKLIDYCAHRYGLLKPEERVSFVMGANAVLSAFNIDVGRRLNERIDERIDDLFGKDKAS